MSGIVGSFFNHRGSGITAKLGTDGHSFNSAGAGTKAVTEAVAAGGDISFGGDTFGADKTIGSNDAYSLNIEAQNDRILRFQADGRMSTQDEEDGHTVKGGITFSGGTDVSTGYNDSDADARAITFKMHNMVGGMTDYFETDSYAYMSESSGGANSSTGGFSIRTMAEGEGALRLEATAVNADSTQSGNAGYNTGFRIDKKSGTGRTHYGNSENCFAINTGKYDSSNRSVGATIFIVRGDGGVYSGGGHNADNWDEYEDAQLVRAFDTWRDPNTENTKGPGRRIQDKWDKFVQYNYETLKDVGVLGNITEEEEAKGQIPFYCIQGLQRVHNGAIWQQYTKHNQLLDAVYDLAAEAIGQEKADELLEKHAIKRLTDDNSVYAAKDTELDKQLAVE
mgnify:CR=1 FL=1